MIRKSITKLPGFVDAGTRERFEADLVRTAAGVGPKELGDVAELTLFLLDQDGPAPDDTERTPHARDHHRPQQRRGGNSTLSGELTPEARAVLEVLFAKYAAPGMCNPDDPEPCTSGTPTQAQIDNDHRSLAQRQHDALIAVGRIALMSGQLGQLNGLPVSIIIRTTLQDLESRAGVGVTGGGTIMPIAEVIRLAAHANHYLAVFDKAHRIGAGPVPRQTGRLPGAADHADRPRRWLHETVLHGRRLRRPGPSRGGRLGRRRQHQRRRTRPGLRTGQPDGRQTVAGPPASTPAAKSNGPHPRSWTPAKPESTTTTDPNDSCTHPTNPNPNRRHRRTPTPEPIGIAAAANRNRSTPWGTMTPISPTNPATTTQVNPHRPNRSGIAAAANRNRSTPWATTTPISPADPRRPTTKRLEGRKLEYHASTNSGEQVSCRR